MTEEKKTPKRATRITEEQKAEIERLYQENPNAKIGEIAEAVGVNYAQARNHIVKIKEGEGSGSPVKSAPASSSGGGIGFGDSGLAKTIDEIQGDLLRELEKRRQEKIKEAQEETESQKIIRLLQKKSVLEAARLEAEAQLAAIDDFLDELNDSLAELRGSQEGFSKAPKGKGKAKAKKAAQDDFDDDDFEEEDFELAGEGN